MPRSRAKAKCATPTLTQNQQMVFDWLRKRRAPASAYDILDALRDQGFRAPPQAYRALERLQSLGIVHRVDSLNAFVACCHPDLQHSTEPVVLAVCSECHAVKEISDQALSKKLAGLSSQCDLLPDGLTVELRGRCARCCRQVTPTKPA